MPPSRSKLFGEIAISKGLLSDEQLVEALKVQQGHRVQGVKKTLGAVAHDLGYLSLIQVNQIMEEVAAERRRGSIEGYQILSKLGKGGMGSVYLARQISLQKLVAIKVLPPRLSSNDEDLARFKREALATAKLNHTNIVQAYDVGESNGYHYLVMEYVEGETVRDVLERDGKLDEPRSVEILEALADALRHAWTQGIVHRDIKPANIVLSKPDGVPKLLDLGLAISKKDDFAITQTGVIMGTPYYLSPEQARSEDLDIRSDIYSLGITLFHILTGQPPFAGDSAAIIVSKHLTEALPDPLERNPTLSNGICYIISKMTAKEREERYQTPEELLADIRELRRLSFLRGKTWQRGPAGGRRGGARLERRTLIRWAGVALTALVPSAVLVALTAADPDLWSRSLDRLRGRGGSGVPIERVAEKAAASAGASADARLAEAERYAAANPGDDEGARNRFAAIAREYGTASDVGARANRRVEAIDRAMAAEAARVFALLREAAREKSAAARYADARALLRTFDRRFKTTPSWEALDEELRRIEREEAAAAARSGSAGDGSQGPPDRP